MAPEQVLNILFVGDVVGKPGRRILAKHLARAQEAFKAHFTIVNGENASGGAGITPLVSEELFELGIDVLTTGNHVFRHKEMLEYIRREPRLLRPLNYPSTAPGAGIWTGKASTGDAVGVFNLLGRVFMDPVDCPFHAADRAISQIGVEVKIKVCDFHAEATSEKNAMGWHLDGRASAVIGTHTHVQTADERVLPNGTAFISDAGMTGAADSVIGVSIDAALRRFTSGIRHGFKQASANPKLNGVVLNVDRKTGAALGIQRIRLGP